MADDIELHERIATIEAEVKHIDEELDDIREDGKARSDEIHAINTKMDELTNELARYRGVVGGILLAATAVLTFVKFIWSDFINWVKG